MEQLGGSYGEENLRSGVCFQKRTPNRMDENDESKLSQSALSLGLYKYLNPSASLDPLKKKKKKESGKKSKFSQSIFNSIQLVNSKF